MDVNYILILVGLFAGLLSGSVGFGGGMVLLPVITSVYGIEVAIPISTVAQLLSNVSRVGMGFMVIKWKQVGLFLICAAPLTALGALGFGVADKVLMTRILCIVLVTFSVLKLFGKMHLPSSKGTMLIGGGITGFVNGMMGISGPLSSAVFLTLGLAPVSYIASEATAATAMHIIKIIVYGKLNLMNLSIFLNGLYIGCAMILGNFVAIKLIKNINKKLYQKFVAGAMILISIWLFFSVAKSHNNSVKSTSSQSVMTNYGNVYYETIGTGSRTVVFVHGLGCDINTWQEQRSFFEQLLKFYDAQSLHAAEASDNRPSKAIITESTSFSPSDSAHCRIVSTLSGSRENFSGELLQKYATQACEIRMVFLDLPGFGKSDKPLMDYTLEQLADAVVSVMDDINTDSAILVGHSLGTAVCRQVAIEHPERVKGLIDIDGVYCLYPKDTLSAQYRDYSKAVSEFADSFETDSLSVLFTNFVYSLAGPSTPSYITDYALSTMPLTPRYVAYNTMHNLIKTKYWTGQTINVPCIVICTENSGISTDNQQLMSELYPKMSYYQLQRCGHFIHMEESFWFNDILFDFINSVYQ